MEFNLSKRFEAIRKIAEKDSLVINQLELDVKEFIKRDWELIQTYIIERINLEGLILGRNKLAGDKLNG